MAWHMLWIGFHFHLSEESTMTRILPALLAFAGFLLAAALALQNATPSAATTCTTDTDCMIAHCTARDDHPHCDGGPQS